MPAAAAPSTAGLQCESQTKLVSVVRAFLQLFESHSFGKYAP